MYFPPYSPHPNKGSPLHPSASLTTSDSDGPSLRPGAPRPGAPRPEGPGTPSALELFNAAPAHLAEATLLTCCRSHRWAERLAAHRPYPDPAALFAAADEASYDLSVMEIADALACEDSPGTGADTPHAALTALRAAHAAYESRFGHAFVICLDSHAPGERLDQILTGIRFRLGNEQDEERAVAADELRRLARGRLARVVGAEAESR
ncbi:2-oxo-4-hydroxy-4-carboxy-5-ureidoimidazoline decarboxylase [Streptomyces sp. NPDC051561]|uniref:2-oxo-4-hydroxy-4-carboxy-5-ureidoimidazoline decarboxylase n=1 Tax=Streptomyces sp. NPDC051561 TaxID=3365658 RepID=UPI0037878FB0